MQLVSVALIDSNNLFRQGLKALFADDEFHITKEVSSLNAALAIAPTDEALQLVLVDPTGLGEATEIVRAFKAAFPGAHLVLLTSKLDGGVMAQAIQAGADAFLMKDMSVQALVQSLRLVMMGEKVFPSDLAALLLNGRLNGSGSMAPELRKGVSQREAQILRCLLNGDSNKLIANRLHITEATVKVHLKSLLRKINAANRTQAAIWGLNNGFAEGHSGATSAA